jgi:mono/diheme cytochrome c family protein
MRNRLVISLILLASIVSVGCDSERSPRPTRGGDDGPSAGLSEQQQFGKLLYRDRCRRCHQADGSGTHMPRSDLRGVFERHDVATIARIIRQGRNPPRMPGEPDLTDEQIDRLIAYLRALQE